MTYSTRLYQLRSKITISPCRKLLNVTLPKHLRFLAIRGSRKRNHAKHAWAHALGDGLDRSALAGRVAAFEQNDDSRSRFFDPILRVVEI
jgi:hypothetical protein